MRSLFNSLLLLVFLLCINTNTFAIRVYIDDILLELDPGSFDNIGIAVWDQREMIVDKSQPETLLGYTRSMTQIAYGSVTRSQKTLSEIVSAKISNAFTKDESNGAVIPTSAKDSKDDLLKNIKNSDFEKVLVIKLNTYHFDGYMKLGYLVDIDILVYSNDGQLLYSKKVSNTTPDPIGKASKLRKVVPEYIQTTFQDILNNQELRQALNQAHTPIADNNKYDIIITKTGDELEARVLEISESSIKYKLASHLEGPQRVMDRKNVFMIKYADGTKEVF